MRGFIIGLCLILVGCVSLATLRDRAYAARADALACLDAHPNSPLTCRPLVDHAEKEMATYQDTREFRLEGARHWGGGRFVPSEPSRSAGAPLLGPITPNAYGPGIHMDATGRPVRAVPWP